MQDIDIARGVKLTPIENIARRTGIPEHALQPYGRYMAKVDPKYISEDSPGKLVLVTAISPTPAGEGKTTVSVGLADALRRIGKSSCLALREPSMGPVFGVKGGAAGGGYAQVAPMEEINLHFTGDLHAITSANNLIAAMIDNHIYQGNQLRIDPRRITFRRCMDMNDRQLRSTISGLNGHTNGTPREDGFDITAASEIMATFCLAADIEDFRKRVSNIVVARTYENSFITAGDLKADGAVAAVMKTALLPNLVQTLEGTPAFVHGGPFANIAHGCNSVIATRLARSLSQYAVTEAGFGAELGAEKFIDIKCRQNNLSPDCVVIVATARALKSHGGVDAKQLRENNPDAVKAGMPNLLRHISNVKNVWKRNAVVAINRFATDTDEEISVIKQACSEIGVRAEECRVWELGGEGGEDLARAVVQAADSCEGGVSFTYPSDMPLDKKLIEICKKIYGAASVTFAPGVKTKLRLFEREGYSSAPVCIAKTQYSFSDNPKLICAPEGFTVNIRDVKLSAGAGFVVAFAGDIIAMPGLPKSPAAESIGIGDDGEIYGLF